FVVVLYHLRTRFITCCCSRFSFYSSRDLLDLHSFPTRRSSDLSVGLHAVLRQVPEDGEHVLVIGGGMIAYTVIAAIRMLGIDCEITQLSLLDYQKKLGENLGVNHGLTNKQDLEKQMLRIPQTKSYKPVIGDSVFLGGFHAVYDCIGSEDSVKDSL